MEHHGREPRPINFNRENGSDDSSTANPDVGPKVVRYFMLAGSHIELFAQVVDHPSSAAGPTIRLFEPLQIFTVPDASMPHSQSILLHEWIPFIDVDYVDIPRTEVIITSSVKDEMSEFYHTVARKFREFIAGEKGSLLQPLQPPKGLEQLAGLDPGSPTFLQQFGKIMDGLDAKSRAKLAAGTSILGESLGEPTEKTDEAEGEKKGDGLDELWGTITGKKPTIH